MDEGFGTLDKESLQAVIQTLKSLRKENRKVGLISHVEELQQVVALVPGINQVIIYLVAIIILLTRPRGLMGRKGVMED